MTGMPLRLSLVSILVKQYTKLGEKLCSEGLSDPELNFKYLYWNKFRLNTTLIYLLQILVHYDKFFFSFFSRLI